MLGANEFMVETLGLLIGQCITLRARSVKRSYMEHPDATPQGGSKDPRCKRNPTWANLMNWPGGRKYGERANARQVALQGIDAGPKKLEGWREDQPPIL